MIDNEIITGKKDKDKAKDSGTSAAAAAAAAAGGAGIAAAAALAATSDATKKKKKISYKMLISKDFGDTLEPWQEYTVYARIVQVHNEAGLTRNADELTRQITAFSDNMPVNSHYHTPSQRCAAMFKITDDNAEKAVLSFQFKGKGGVFTEHITFKVNAFEKKLGFMYINSDNSIGEIFYDIEKIRTHGLFLGENTCSTVYIFVSGFAEVPTVTGDYDTNMLRPAATHIPNFESSPLIFSFAREYSRYSFFLNCKFFKADLGNRTGKPTTAFGKYPLKTTVTFTARSKRGATAKRTLPVTIVPRGFFVDISRLDERQKSHEYIDLYTN